MRLHHESRYENEKFNAFCLARYLHRTDVNMPPEQAAAICWVGVIRNRGSSLVSKDRDRVSLFSSITGSLIFDKLAIRIVLCGGIHDIWVLKKQLSVRTSRPEKLKAP